MYTFFKKRSDEDYEDDAVRYDFVTLQDFLARPASAEEYVQHLTLPEIVQGYSTSPSQFRPLLNDARDVSKLLYHVVHGEQDMAESLLREKPELLLKKGQVTDDSGRTFHNVSAFQCALWSLDTHFMTRMMLDCIPKDETGELIREALRKQYDDIQGGGGGNDLVRLPEKISLNKAAQYLENNEGIVCCKNDDGYDAFYYINKDAQVYIDLTDPWDSDCRYPRVPELEQRTEKLNKLLPLMFANIKEGSARSSTDEEYNLLKNTLGIAPARKGVQYSYKGERYCNSHYGFGVIEALEEFESYLVDRRFEHLHEQMPKDLDKTLWTNIRNKQSEFPRHIKQHYYDPREFCSEIDSLIRTVVESDTHSSAYANESVPADESVPAVLLRGKRSKPTVMKGSPCDSEWYGDFYGNDSRALTHLYETRLADSLAIRKSLAPAQDLVSQVKPSV